MVIFLLVMQIITESLPISSSAHVALLQNFLQHCGCEMSDVSPLLWSVHGITACFMIYIMRSYWMPFIRHPWRTRLLIVRMFLYGLCAEIITVVLYGTLYPYVQGRSYLLIGCTVTMIALFSLKFCRRSYNYHSWYVWLVAGAVQGLAVIPGCSRMALTYAAACWLGYSGRHALTLSFTLALPIFIAGSLYGTYELLHTSFLHQVITVPFVIGVCVASVIAYGALLFSCRLMIQERLYYMGWYMMLMLLVVSR